MNILAIPGSIREESYNLALLKAMAHLSKADMEITVFSNIKNIPLFDPNIDDNNLPQAVSNLLKNIRHSDGIIISTPEYAHGITGILKNLLDWLVASDVIILKPVVVTSVSTSGLGGVRAHSPLVLVLSAMNAHVVVEASLNIPYAKMKFNQHNALTDKLTKQAISVSLQALEQTILNQK